MVGEDPQSRDPDDTRHWVSVYAELLRAVRAVPPSGDPEQDARRNRAEALYARRLRYWQTRSGSG